MFLTQDDEQTVGMAAFLPHQNLWKWSSKGHKRIKTRCLHREIRRGGRRGGRGSGGERLSVGDCAVFLSTGRPDRPYVGRLESLWETSSGQMRVKVRWFYHATETEGTAQGGRRVQDLKLPVSTCFWLLEPGRMIFKLLNSFKLQKFYK